MRFSWMDPKFRSIVYQITAVAMTVLLVWFLVTNTIHNLAAHNIASGFGYLARPAGFAISESWLPYSPLDTYGYAILVGLSNTLRVAVVGIAAATILGTLTGIARVSRNPLVAGIASGYVEVIRNIPLLIQLFFWYVLITQVMPGPRAAHMLLPGVFLSNRGLAFPTITGVSASPVLVSAALVVILAIVLWRLRTRNRVRTGAVYPYWRYVFVALAAIPFISFLMSGRDIRLDTPALSGFNFSGGTSISPEFTTLMLGLVIYTAAYIGEIVRAGIRAIHRGQWEAARSIGLSNGKVLQLVVLPQALRVIIPPLASQYLNFVKNSSLAVAIGFPDIVAVVDTVLNQTGQAIECILIVMAAYLTVSLSISLFMNWYNERLALTER
ncbi:amino ABC transporter, permease, 3-TM region, His/Glu/Gln/Arg/opine family domain protein [Burkholderia cepacia]|nr:amino ABC transporter, permease, 3-TM region, His/Glu/Gln/Arg/opine family domain protein [Burkholderia cepacia]KGC04696.1 amino ABC transporter, permease, 3-TM region, His/Glu/Gln/Arg/opine family domain protein [Burkholderia cepacia]